MKRKREPSTESAEPDDEEMEEDNEDREENEGNNSQGDEDEEDDESGDESDESDESDSPPVELMVTSRERRANAGNKMAKLLHSTVQEDDFYSGAYEGGFKDDDVEDVYVSPVSDDEDDVDSDFDRPEEEDEPISDQEDKDKQPRKKKKTLYKEPKQKPDLDVFSMNKKWAIDRVDKVLHNECDARTQAQRMKEAEKTERENAASLNRFEEFEIEKRKRREKALKHGMNGPYMSIKSTPTGNLLVLPQVKQFQAPHMPPAMVCAVTGQRARYRDTVTGLPYANASAFTEIRTQYEQFLRGIKGNAEVSEYLERLDKELDEESDSEDNDDHSESSF
ncbi:unnamed protein product, partial [Mesorhabditis belari]|uniref:Vacuolar protein sorting-associated protein 72 homolog n=1 Tax=Mesorhabditis belari TaxID=2138241 RepID=A0AAF3FDS5_9BILA